MWCQRLSDSSFSRNCSQNQRTGWSSVVLLSIWMAIGVCTAGNGKKNGKKSTTLKLTSIYINLREFTMIFVHGCQGNSKSTWTLINCHFHLILQPLIPQLHPAPEPEQRLRWPAPAGVEYGFDEKICGKLGGFYMFETIQSWDKSAVTQNWRATTCNNRLTGAKRLHMAPVWVTPPLLWILEARIVLGDRKITRAAAPLKHFKTISIWLNHGITTV